MNFSETIGQSVKGLPIRIVSNIEIEDLPGEQFTLLIGGIHGDERAPVSLLSSFIDKYFQPGAMTDLVCVIPVLNPDGYRDRTRHNSRGVDLNRDFPRIRNAGINGKTGAGSLSEPETRSLHKFIHTMKPSRIVSLHWALSEIDADGEQSYSMANQMWDALSEDEKKLYRLKLGKLETEGSEEMSGSLGQWCGYGLQYPDKTRPVMITLELPYTYETEKPLHPLPKDSFERVGKIWRENPEEYLKIISPSVDKILAIACMGRSNENSEN